MNHNSFNSCCPNQCCHRVMLQARFRRSSGQPGSCLHSAIWDYAAFSCLCRGIYMKSHNLFQYVLLCYSWYQPALRKLVQRRLNMCVVSPDRPRRPLPWHFDEIWRETECCRGNIYVLTHLNTPPSEDTFPSTFLLPVRLHHLLPTFLL